MLFDQPKIVENSEIVNSTIAHGTSYPDNPNAGELFYREDLNKFSVHNGITWVVQSTANDLASHTADSTLHLTAAQNTFLDAINLPTIAATSINDIPATTLRVSTAENTLASHISNTNVHISAAQDIFLDGLDLPNLSSTEVNYLKGVTSPIQTQINNSSGSFTSHINDDTRHLVPNEDTFLGSLDFSARTPAQRAADLNNAFSHYNDLSVHLTSAQNTYLDGLTIAFADTNKLSGIDSFLNTSGLGATVALALASLNNSKVNRSGDTMTGTLTMASGAKITGLPTPVSGSDAVNKDYVDIFIQGIHWTTSVNAGTTQNITLSGLQTIDNIALASGDRVLVKDQNTSAENGIYVASSGAWARAFDYNAVNEINQSATFIKSGGPVNGKASFLQTNTIATIGIDAVAFTAFSGPVINSAGNGISLQPNGGVSVNQGAGLTFVGSILTTDLYIGGGLMTTVDNTLSSSLDTAQIALTNVGTAGTYRSVTTDTKGRITAGTNPTTIAGYGLTDALNKTGDTATGTMSFTGGVSFAINPTVNSNALLNAGNFNSYSPSLTGNGASGNWNINVNGSAATLTTGRVISASGDATGSSVAFNGSAAVNIPLTLNNVNGNVGTYYYPTVTVNAKGLITSIATNNAISVSGAVTGSQFISTATAPNLTFGGNASSGLYADNSNVAIRTTAAGGTIYFQRPAGAYTTATLDAYGNFVASGDVTAFSDARVKTDVQIITDALSKIQAIRGVTFVRTDFEDNKRHAGVIAQEVEAVLPEVISENGNGIKSVAYGNMVALLIEAVKELNAEVKLLKQEIQELKK